MKHTIILLFILSNTFLFSQNYFEGKRLYCKSENPEAIRLFNIGIETLKLNTSLNKKYLKKTSEVFLAAYKEDTTFCDAMFFTGYTLRLLDDKYAFAYYYVADSLANNKSIEFKTNLASEGLRSGIKKGLEIARRKYSEIVEFFPDSPEGYYGIALTSTEIGDIENGLKNINLAINKYKSENKDALFLKAILLTLNTKHEESLSYYEKVKSEFKKMMILTETML
ncbi:tetratricopeptide repeat protein [Lacinutrix salivirga]